MTRPPYEQASAQISPDGLYRTRLFRRWGPGPTLGIIGLNPSTADGESDDTTIRREVDFAKRDGYGALWKENLFSFRATHPRDMRAAADPVGPDGDAALRIMIDGVDGRVVAAWGTGGTYRGRDREVMAMVQESARDLYCYGLTKDGHPRHPSRLRSDAPMVAMTWALG